mgnify:FL=1
MRICPECKKIYDDSAIYCTECGKKTIEKAPEKAPEKESASERKNQVSGLAAIAFVFAMTTLLFGVLFVESTKETNSYRVKYQEVKEVYNETKEKADFMDDYIRIVSTSTNDGYYHKYECSDLDTTRFMAFNVDAAIVKGYEPCPKCCG